MNANTLRPGKIMASIITAIASCLIAQGSMAEGINLSWNDCGLMGFTNRSFACNSNTMSNASLYASFVPTIESGFATSRELVFDLVSESPTLPDWWQLGPGGCRAGAMSLDADFTAGPWSCLDPWLGLPVTIASVYTAPFAGQSRRARLVVTMQVQEPFALPPDYDMTEWYALRIRLSATKTTGPLACANCVVPMCVLFTSLRLYSPGSAAPLTLVFPLDRNWATWQGGPPGGSCLVGTPARNTTWGRLKSLYY